MKFGMRVLAGICSIIFGVLIVCYAEVYFIIFNKFPYYTITFGSPDSNMGVELNYGR